MNEELKNALEALQLKLEGASKLETKTAIEAFKSSLDATLEAKLSAFMTADSDSFIEMKNDFEKAKEQNTEFKNRVNEMETKLSKMKSFEAGDEIEDFAKELKSALRENATQIGSVSKGRNASFEMKAVGIMTNAANLTGDSVKTYQNGVAVVPTPLINMADLVPQIQSSTGTYVVYRETGSEGSIGLQSAVAADKNQIDYDFTEVVFNARYIAGYARFAKQMAQDLPFLTSFLPEAMRRDYYKAENGIFYAALKAAATVSTVTATVGIERIIEDTGVLENADFPVTGILINPVDWATIAVTKPGDYSLPSIVTFINGQLTINGIPVYKASFVPVDEYMVGDWSQAKKIVTDGLSVEFFEQDQDNVIKNLITARVESRTVLGIDRPDGFITGVLTAV